MKSLKSVALACTAAVALNASAVEINNGTFGSSDQSRGYIESALRQKFWGTEKYESYRNLYPAIRFQLNRFGDRLELKDLKRNIQYNVDLKRQGEQYLPQAYINALASRPERLGALAQYIKSISISEINETDNSISATFKIRLSVGNRFLKSHIDAVVAVSARADKQSCALQEWGSKSLQDGTNNSNYTSRVRNVSCFQISAGQAVDVVDFKIQTYPSGALSAVDGALTTTMAAFADLILKASGAHLYTHSYLIRMGMGRNPRGADPERPQGMDNL